MTKKERVYMNENQYFECIEKRVWNYQIGGYQVLFQWLKDRRTRLLTLEDIKHYCRIVASIKMTIEIKKK